MWLCCSREPSQQLRTRHVNGRIERDLLDRLALDDPITDALQPIRIELLHRGLWLPSHDMKATARTSITALASMSGASSGSLATPPELASHRLTPDAAQESQSDDQHVHPKGCEEIRRDCRRDAFARKAAPSLACAGISGIEGHFSPISSYYLFICALYMIDSLDAIHNKSIRSMTCLLRAGGMRLCERRDCRCSPTIPSPRTSCSL